jgi:hypothetical protein
LNVVLGALCCTPSLFSGEPTALVENAKANASRNVALNVDGADFPKATSNSVYHDMAIFAAKNVINGRNENKGHGGPFPSWGPHLIDDLWLKIDFGKEVEIDKMVIYIRADFTPYTKSDHDSWWKSGILEFSDGSKLPFKLKRTADAQVIPFPKRQVSWVKFTKLIRAEDIWCAFSEVEFWGKVVTESDHFLQFFEHFVYLRLVAFLILSVCAQIN